MQYKVGQLVCLSERGKEIFGLEPPFDVPYWEVSQIRGIYVEVKGEAGKYFGSTFIFSFLEPEIEHALPKEDPTEEELKELI